MRLTFHGAARTVTGSKHLLEVNGHRILLDCGLFQGRRADTYEQNLHFKFADKYGTPINPAKIDVMVLSHAHIDHSGNIPNLVKQGFSGDIITTSATRDLCAVMLADSGHIQMRDVEYVNKKRARQGLAPVEPLYTQEDALRSMRLFASQEYHRTHQIVPGVHMTLHDAGHMLGSAFVVLDIDDQEQGRTVRLVFSGDIGCRDTPIIRDPETIDHADVLIMESTYGDRLHDNYANSEAHLKQIVKDTHQRGGAVLIPAFAVGRTQQMIYSLYRLMQSGDIPHLPIFIDSPLAIDATSVYRMHPECYDDEIVNLIMQANGGDPFGFHTMTYTRSVEESMKLNTYEHPCVIISASGMLEYGRILHHLKNRVEDPKNSIIIASWQAEHTLGRKLVDGAKHIRIFNESYQVNAQVEVLNGFSGHADYENLTGWVGAMKKRPGHIFLVHGEEEPAFALKNHLHEKLGIAQIDVPVKDQTFKL